MPSIIERAGVLLNQHPALMNFLDRALRPVEILSKKPIFGCQMCGQCVLHSTGMVCPMTCPKMIRNGPCGGVRSDGRCEVYPDRDCIWLKAYERSLKLPWHEEMHELRNPVDWSLKDSSSWINALTGRDNITSGCEQVHVSGPDVVSDHGT